MNRKLGLNKRAITKIQAIIIAVIVIVAAVLVGAYALLTYQAPGAATIKIGCPFPMTGEQAHLGSVVWVAAQMSAEYFNNKGGVLGKQIELVLEDGKCLPSEGLAAIERLIHYEKVDVIAGATCSGVTLAAGPIIQENKIPYMCTGESNPKLQLGCGKGGWDWIFTQYPRDDERMVPFIKYTWETKGDKTYCLLTTDNDYGRGLEAALRDEIGKRGGTVLSTDFFVGEEVEFRPVLTKIKGLKPDAFIITAYTDSGMKILKQAHEVGVKDAVKNMYSTCCLCNTGIAGEIGADSVNGLIEQEAFMATGDEALAINTEFKKRTGEDFWGDPFVDYMAIRILCLAIEKAGSTDHTAVRDAMKSLKWSVLGLGDATFDEYNHARYPVYMKQMINGEVKLISIVWP